MTHFGKTKNDLPTETKTSNVTNSFGSKFFPALEIQDNNFLSMAGSNRDMERERSDMRPCTTYVRGREKKERFWLGKLTRKVREKKSPTSKETVTGW